MKRCRKKNLDENHFAIIFNRILTWMHFYLQQFSTFLWSIVWSVSLTLIFKADLPNSGFRRRVNPVWCTQKMKWQNFRMVFRSTLASGGTSNLIPSPSSFCFWPVRKFKSWAISVHAKLNHISMWELFQVVRYRRSWNKFRIIYLFLYT